MDPLRIVVRVVFTWFFVLAGTRLSGKRTIAEVTVFDFVLALILGDMFDDLIWAEVSAATFSVAVGTLISLDVAASLVALRVPAFAHVMGSIPVALIRRGRLVRRGTRRERLRAESVAMLLRQVEVSPADVEQVQGMWIDGAGQPAVVMKQGARPADYALMARLRAQARARRRRRG
jgi:uncharacterized membrane protein YcaP (DUF421 family)